MARNWFPYAVSFVVILLTAIWLLYIGRDAICPCGTVKLWYGEPASPENSKHILDWYSPSHMIHGFLFFGGLWIVARRLSFGWRLAIATAIEAAWEIVENSNAIIERYRTTTVSDEYSGDSVLNSMSDLMMMWLGFWLASRLPVWLSVLIVIGFELLTTWLIRDGLTLNVIMLLYPVEAIKLWQAGG